MRQVVEDRAAPSDETDRDVRVLLFPPNSQRAMRSLYCTTYIVAALFGILTTPLWAQERETLDGCPPEAEHNRDKLERFLTADKWAEARDNAGVSDVHPSEVRLLTDATDPEVCEQLAYGSFKSDWLQRSFYKVGPYYATVSTYLPSDETPEGELPSVSPMLFIIDIKEDGTYRLLGNMGTTYVIEPHH